MASGSTISTVAWAYKRIYIGNRPAELAERDHPLYSMIKKVPNSFGEDARYFIRYANPQATGGTFSTIQALGQSTSSSGVQMAMTPSAKFSVVTIDGVSLKRSEGNRAAIIKLTTLETEGALEEHGDSCAFDLYRTTSAVRGQRESIATNVIQLASPDDSHHFKVGMTLIASPNADGSSPRAGSAKVVAVNFANGTVEVDSAAGITGFADNDFLFRSGDAGTAVQGLADNFPLTAPVFGVDSFRGVDRGASPELLAGVRLNDLTNDIEENAGLLQVQQRRNAKVTSDCLFLNPINAWDVIKRQQARVEFQKAGGTAEYGFEYFKIYTPAGTLKMYPDPDCPENRAYLLKMSDAMLAHAGAPVHIISDDGKTVQRQSTDDGIEVRMRSITQPYFHKPAAHGVFAI